MPPLYNPSWKSYSKAEQKTITNTAKLAYILKDICEVVPTTKTEKEDTLSPLNEKGVNQALKEIDKQLKSYAESILLPGYNYPCGYRAQMNTPVKI